MAEPPSSVRTSRHTAPELDSHRSAQFKARLRSAARGLLASGLVLCAVDFGSELGWGEFGHGYSERSTLQWTLELVLLTLGLFWVARSIPRWSSRLLALPIPRPAFAVLGLVSLIEVGHIFIQSESFPFSNVGMFQYAVPPKAHLHGFAKEWYVLEQKGAPMTSVSLFREGGGPLFRRYGDWDARTAWLVRAHRQHPRSRSLLSQLVGESEERRLNCVRRIQISMADGTIVAPQGLELR